MMKMLKVIPRFDIAFRPQTRLWNSLFSDWVIPSTGLEECGWVPPSDIAETDTEYFVTMELPGMDMKKLDISFSESVLSVKGEKYPMVNHAIVQSDIPGLFRETSEFREP